MSEVISQAELFKALVEYKYIVFKDGNLIVTQDFYQDFKNPGKMEVSKKVKEVAKLDISPPSLGVGPVTIKKVPVSILAEFIIKAEVPVSARTKTGTYALNKYNEKANKILEKALKEGMEFDVLALSTKLYYRSGVIPKTIGNYFIEGLWKDEYNKLVDKMSEGEASANTYIKGVLKESEGNTDGESRYRRR